MRVLVAIWIGADSEGVVRRAGRPPITRYGAGAV